MMRRKRHISIKMVRDVKKLTGIEMTASRANEGHHWTIVSTDGMVKQQPTGSVSIAPGGGVRKEGGDVVNDSGDHTKIPIDPQGLVERGRVPCSNGKSRPAGRWSRTPDTVCLASAVNGGELVSEIRPN